MGSIAATQAEGSWRRIRSSPACAPAPAFEKVLALALVLRPEPVVTRWRGDAICGPGRIDGIDPMRYSWDP